MVKSIKDTGPSSMISSILGGIRSVSLVSFLSAWPGSSDGLPFGLPSSVEKLPCLPGGSSAGGVPEKSSLLVLRRFLLVLCRFRGGDLSSIVRKYGDRTLIHSLFVDFSRSNSKA